MATRTVSQLTAVISANNTKFKKGIGGAKKELNVFQKAVNSVGPMIAGAFATTAIINFGKEAVLLSSQMEGVRTAFNGLNQPDLLDNLKTATRDTVSELKLMQAAVKAKNFKIPLEDLAGFFEFATNRAIQTGESVDYLVESIINGIGRKSALVLDNLGISAAELQDEMRLTGDFAAAAGNIIKKSLEEAGDVASTTSIKINKLATDFENLKTKVGSTAITIYEDLGLWKEWLTEGWGYGASYEIDQIAESVDRAIEKNPELKTQAERIKKIGEEADLAAERARRVFRSIDDLTKLNTPLKQTGATIGLMFSSYINQTGVIADVKVQIARTEQEILAASESELSVLQGKLFLLNEELDRLNSIYEVKKETRRLELAPDPTNAAAPSQTPKTADPIFDGEFLTNADLGKKKIEEVKEAGVDMSDTLAVAFGNIGSRFAESLGTIIGTTDGVKEELDRLGAAVFAAMGDIMIMAGVKMGFTAAGIGLILGGMLIKGIGAFGQAQSGGSGGGGSPFAAATTSNTHFNSSVSGNSNVLYGNDIRNSNNYYTDLYNRVG